jgi:hypothetical protein
MKNVVSWRKRHKHFRRFAAISPTKGEISKRQPTEDPYARRAIATLERLHIEPGDRLLEKPALEWFADPQARWQVVEILNQFHLDETAIEAEAIRAVAEDLELLERMLLSLKVRRNRALRRIADYREVFAVQVQEVSDRILDPGPILQLQNGRPTVD